MIIGALNNDLKEKLLNSGYHPEKGVWDDEELVREIHEIALGSFKRKQPPEIKGTGYVWKVLRLLISFRKAHNDERNIFNLLTAYNNR